VNSRAADRPVTHADPPDGRPRCGRAQFPGYLPSLLGLLAVLGRPRGRPAVVVLPLVSSVIIAAVRAAIVLTQGR